MSRQNICISTDDYVHGAHEAVCWVVDSFRRAHKNEEAIELTAKALNLTPRRVWALRYLTQPVRVLREQYRLLQHRKWEAMDAEATRLRALAEQIKRQKEAEQLAHEQLVLPLGLGDGAKCLSKSAHGSPLDDGDTLQRSMALAA